jgi:hypothetical protein
MPDNSWLREQIAFAIWNDATNPPAIRDKLTLADVRVKDGNPLEMQAEIEGGYAIALSLKLDWFCNRKAFLRLADDAMAALAAAADEED